MNGAAGMALALPKYGSDTEASVEPHFVGISEKNFPPKTIVHSNASGYP